MLELKNLTFEVPLADGSKETKRIIDDLSLTIPDGRFTVITGPNGGGKSTLAKHVNALLVPDEGSVTVLDRDTRDERSTYFIRSHAGMVFQNPDDQLVASLIENDVAFGPENLGVPTRRCRAGRSNAWPSPACWPWSPPSSSWTRPRPCWTRAGAKVSCACAASCMTAA